MHSKDTSEKTADRDALLAMEKATVAAFKAKQDEAFTKHFSSAYVGVANDGFKTAADEVAGMHGLDLRELTLDEEKVAFPAANVGIVTYVMKVAGSHGGQPVEGNIYTATVYVQTGAVWEAVLHTESMAPQP